MMRSIFVGFVLFALAGQTGDAFGYACNQRHYVNVSGHVVHSPSCGVRGEGTPHAVCRDGSISFSEHHRGTCSRHGGVAAWR